MTIQLKGKVAIVTGGNSGIGKSVAHYLAKDGCKVVIAGRRQNLNEKVARMIQKDYKAMVLPVQVDVSEEKGCIGLIAKTKKAFGRVDILINNAGVYGGELIANTTTEEFDRVLKTNLYSAFWCSRESFKYMKKHGGYIINISSVAGKEAWSETGAYSASKFGMVALSQSLADEGKQHNIKCTAICPAGVATPLTGNRGIKYLQPSDIAETVMYLLRLSPATWPTEIVLPRKDAE